MSDIKACRDALTAILSAWRTSTAPPKHIRPWLEQARELVSDHAPAWDSSQLQEATAELAAWARYIRSHPDEYAMDAGEISFNSATAHDHFPTFNTLYDESPSTSARPEPRRRRRRGESSRATSRTRSRSPKREPDSSDDERTRTERSLAPHPARHPEQYKLVRLRPL
ncbi:hypothetical protein JCM8208_002578 [Rhodotorula glutinis]